VNGGFTSMQSRRSCSLMKLVPPPLFHTGPEGTAGDSPGPWQRASGCCHRILCRHNSQPQHSDGVRARALHIKRRAEPAAVIYSICCHTLRTTGLPRIYGRAERWSTHRLPITNRRERRNYMTEPRGTVVRGVERIKSERLYQALKKRIGN
jgi:hypothetical protein